MMVNQKIRDQYTVTIGIECHVQLKTATKLFAGVGNDARDAAPNTLISHICLGMPGALPVLNAAAVTLASRAAFALGTKPQRFSKFDRKHYFYPDLPMGYQITQFYDPIIKNGFVDIRIDGTQRRIGIHEAHLEADAGKSTHPAGKDYSLIDLNRAGTPLLEIVSEPDMHSPLEAKIYARELWLLMRYAEVSDADLYHGNMRFDVNVSVSKDPNVLGTRTETKNLNSFRSVERAAEYEIERQISLLEKGEEINQETRGWDDAKQQTFSQRSKEEAHDYRYMPDPDIPPIELDDEAIDAIGVSMPVLPNAVRQVLSGLAVDNSAIETLVEELPAGKFIYDLIQAGREATVVKRIVGWLTSEVQAMVGTDDLTWETVKLDAQSLTELAAMAADNKVSSTGAKQILADLVKTGGSPTAIAEAKNLLQVSDEGAINAIVAQVLADNPQAAADVQKGEVKAIGFLVGQVMKQSQGKANPQLAQSLIRKQLEQ